MGIPKKLVGLLLVSLIAAWNISIKLPWSLPASGLASLHDSVSSPAVSAPFLEAYGKLPLSFEVNRGQAGPDIQFLSRGRGLAMFLGSGDAAFLIGQEDSSASRRQSMQKRHKI